MITFDDWLKKTQCIRDEITAFSKVSIVNIDKAIDYSAEIGLMENMADSYAKLEFARLLREARTVYPDATAKEREAYVNAAMIAIKQFVSDLAIIGRVLRDRIYCQNRSR